MTAPPEREALTSLLSAVQETNRKLDEIIALMKRGSETSTATDRMARRLGAEFVPFNDGVAGRGRG